MTGYNSQYKALLVGGKGGVGKTTCASAIAARLAASGQKTLLITSDMAPSLSDIFEQELGGAITTVGSGLDACEISQEAVFSWWRNRFGRDFSDILNHLIDVASLDKDSQHQLLEYIGSAPSLREETLLDMIRDLATTRGYDRVVWDTAPAGETLNLLDMPANIRKHLRAGAKVFESLDLIGKQLTGKRSIATIMDEWGGASDEISQFLRTRSEFLIVSNPETLVVNQTRRLFTTLSDYRLPIRGLIINCVIENADSPSLVAAQETQVKYVRELKEMAGGKHIAIVPRSFTEIRGVRRLEELGKDLVTGLSL